MKTACLGLLFLSCVFAPAALGCAASEEHEDAMGQGEAALVTPRTLVRDVPYPSGLAVAAGFVYFGANGFVASGDPELDQQFAYWTGKYSRVPISGGRAKTAAEDGPITKVRVSGTKLYYAMAAGCWISRLDAATGDAGTSVYRKDDCEPDWGATPAGFEVAGGKLYVIDSDGTVFAGREDGAAMRKIGEVRVGDHAGVVDSHAFADGFIYIVTQRNLTSGRRVLPQSLFKIPASGGAPEKVFDFPSAPSSVVSDGRSVYYSLNDTEIFAVRPGATQPEKVAEGLGNIVDLAADGGNLYVADAKRGAVYVVRDAATAPKGQEKLANAAGVTTLTAKDGVVYFGTHVVEARKPAGIIGSIQVPPAAER
jgi:hypothetical protein